MAKKKVLEPRREITKRQLSRWQQQERRQRIVFGSGIFVIVAVLAILGVGWYINQYKPLHQTVIRVNDVKFDMDYYVKMLSYYGKGQSIQFMQSLADPMAEIIQKNELVRQAAITLGISVSDNEVDNKLNSFNPPLSKDYRDAVRGQMLLDKLKNEYFDKQVPVLAEQRHIMAMLLESESQADEVKAKLEGGEDFGKLASELSLESFSKDKGGDLGWRPKGILTRLLNTAVPEEYAFSNEVGLSQPVHDEAVNKTVGYWLIKLLKRDEAAKQAFVKVILLGSEKEAQEVRARLEAGEDFTTLAKELSQHDVSKEKGGDLDVTSPDMISSAFSKFVFDPKVELETLSQPIRDEAVTTKGGYWLLKVVGMEDNRKISDEDKELLKNVALNKWIEATVNNPENKVESYLDDEKMAWAIRRAAGI